MPDTYQWRRPSRTFDLFHLRMYGTSESALATEVICFSNSRSQVCSIYRTKHVVQQQHQWIVTGRRIRCLKRLVLGKSYSTALIKNTQKMWTWKELVHVDVSTSCRRPYRRELKCMGPQNPTTPRTRILSAKDMHTSGNSVRDDAKRDE